MIGAELREMAKRARHRTLCASSDPQIQAANQMIANGLYKFIIELCDQILVWIRHGEGRARPKAQVSDVLKSISEK